MNIPNLLSIFRLVLVPVFTYEFLANDNFVLAGVLLLVSGITDCLDGWIARKFNMITNLGKILDPLADKLTQIVTVLCLAIKGLHMMWILLAVLVIKDLIMLIGGITIYRKKEFVVSSNWYGKIATIVFYVAVISMSLFNSVLDATVKNVITGLIIFALVLAFVGYVSYFFSIRAKKIE